MNKTSTNFNPLVTIIIPVFNSKHTVVETILCCLNQTWNNIEILVIDDGSTDNSVSIVKTIYDSRIKIFQQKNKGACAARNLGLQHSSGDYIQFLDADDLISPDKIENQLELLQDKSNAIASCSWGRFTKTISNFKISGAHLNKNYSKPINWLIDSWNGKGMGQTSIWLTPTKILKGIEPWNEELTINQDGEYFARVLMQVDQIVFCSNSKVYYRSDNNNSISKAAFTEAKALSLLNSYKSYVITVAENLKDIKVKKALARNFADLIYRFGNQYPVVASQAWTELQKLDVQNFEPVGGKTMHWLISYFGFEKAVFIRKLISSLMPLTKKN